MDAIRVLVGSTVATLLLGLGVLEVTSQRVRPDPPSTAASDAQADLPDVELGPAAGWESETVQLVETEEC
jgi:hypothetical protein